MQKKTLLISVGVFVSLIFLFVIFYVVGGAVLRFRGVNDQESGTYNMGGVIPGIDSVDMAYDPTLSSEKLVNDQEGSKVQKNGSMSLLVEDIDESVDSVKAINLQYSGQVTNIYDYGRGNDRVVTVTVKIPVKDFEAYYEEIRNIEGEVTYANVSTTDVTEEYIDITSRLKNLKSVESQLVGILEKADTVTDILAVQRELNTVRGEIESYEQRKRYFDSQTDYSHISISFSIDKTGLNISEEEWKPWGEFKAALTALVSVLKGFVNATIWVLVFSPIILVPVGIVLFLTKRKK